MKAKGPITQLGGLKGGDVMKSTTTPGGATPSKSSSFAGNPNVNKHHAPLHSDHTRSTKSTRGKSKD